jgi:splicing factor 3B subunit 2
MGEPIDKNAWGELEPEEGWCSSLPAQLHAKYCLFTEEEEEESEEESEEEEAAEPAPADGLQTPSGLETPSGMTSVVSTVAGGLETPDFLELRKHSARSTMEAVESGPRSLYQVVPEKQTSVRGLMGSDRGYDVSAVSGAPIPVLGDERGTKVFSVSCALCLDLTAFALAQRKANGVDVSIDASELEGLSEEELRRKYDTHSRGSAGVAHKEDFSDMVAKEMAKKRQKMDRERDVKKGKEFKF